MPSTEAYDIDEQNQLLRLAAASIRFGLKQKRRMTLRVSNYPAHLQQVTACFVTLTRNENLRGCMGSLFAHRALVDDVAANAFAAAFEDPRFPPLVNDEFPHLEISISILTPAHAMSFTSERDLLKQLKPHVDGLILSEAYQRSTFLPAVWESLPNPEEFLQHLKMKAGLAPNYWSPSIKIERYTTASFHKTVSAIE